MADTATVNISGSVSGDPLGSRSIGPFTITNAASVPNQGTQAFTAATFAAVVVPAGAIGVIIQPPASNTGTINLKGVTGDSANLLLHKTNPTLLCFDTSFAFGLLCQNSITVEFEWF